MKNFLLLLIIAFPSISYAQTEISGIINNYAAVLDYDACEGDFTVQNSAGFSVGDRVMLIQMKGAEIVEQDNAAFGTITDLASAGLYEMNTVSAVGSGLISLEFSLLNEYDVSGFVQLVSVPVYESATVTSELMAAPWNGTTGGIIALEVNGALTLNADINADGAGFRGGELNVVESDCNFAFNQDNYFYADGNWRGSSKGEGIANWIAGKEWGRGPQATGGGGGNDHNSGGGGGSNVVSGGQGGNRTPEGLFGCDGDFPGLGGMSFTTSTIRAFLGGGGGAGHVDNVGAGSAGGNGGGIVYVKSGDLIGNTNRISAAGLGNDAAGDGAGGGGAGGTLIIEVGSVSGNPVADASGGKGGNTQSLPNACNGPGGGGSGGRILTNMPGDLAINLMPGDAGVNTNPNSLCSGASNGATDGTQGLLDIIFTAPASAEPFIPLEIVSQPQSELNVCPGTSFALSVGALGNSLSYQWQADFGSGFMDLGPSGAYTGENQTSLIINNPMQNMSGWAFRVVVMNFCGDELISDATMLDVLDPTVPGFTFANAGPYTIQFTDISTGGLSITYDFGDMSGTGEANPLHVFPGPGSYTVTQVVSGPCGVETFEQIINLSVLPTAAFSADVESGCSTLTVNFVNESLGAPTNLSWEFPGGLPSAITNDPEPTIMYPTPGVYDVTLIASNDTGTDTIVMTQFIEVADTPVAGFSFGTDDLDVALVNESTGATTYLWDFGDMTSSTLENPGTHTYSEPGTYEICLTAMNECGNSETCLQIIAGEVPIAAFEASQISGCAPLSVTFNDLSSSEPVEWLWQFPGGIPTTSNEPNPTVVYSTPGVYTVTLNVSNLVGSGFKVIENYISVEGFPEPMFSFQSDIDDDLTVNFFNETTSSVNQYIWDFGDGNVSSEFSPTHTYEAVGTYIVTLNALNASCGATNSQQVAIISDIDDPTSLPTVQVYPVPFVDDLYVRFEEVPDEPVALRLVSATGQVVLVEVLENQSFVSLNTSRLPSGIYFVQFTYKGRISTVKVIK